MSEEWAKGSVQELIERAASNQKEDLEKALEAPPRQRLPGWIRWPIRALFLPFVLLDCLMEKWAKKVIPPPYQKVGACLKRGNCCRYILIEAPKGLLGRLHLWWNLEINGFYLRQEGQEGIVEEEGKKMQVLGCRYLNRDGSCRHYHLRPKICRDWPLIERFGRPHILKGCGYQIKAREK